MIFFKTLYTKQIWHIHFLFWSFETKLELYYFKRNDKINILIENHDTDLASKKNEVYLMEEILKETNIFIYKR